MRGYPIPDCPPRSAAGPRSPLLGGSEVGPLPFRSGGLDPVSPLDLSEGCDGPIEHPGLLCLEIGGVSLPLQVRPGHEQDPDPDPEYPTEENFYVVLVRASTMVQCTYWLCGY